MIRLISVEFLFLNLNKIDEIYYQNTVIVPLFLTKTPSTVETCAVIFVNFSKFTSKYQPSNLKNNNCFLIVKSFKLQIFCPLSTRLVNSPAIFQNVSFNNRLLNVSKIYPESFRQLLFIQDTLIRTKDFFWSLHWTFQLRSGYHAI